MCSHKNKIENILNEFSFCCQGHAPGWEGLRGVGGSQKLERGDLRWRPHRLHPLVVIVAVCVPYIFLVAPWVGLWYVIDV